jgi:hypothetical protein
MNRSLIENVIKIGLGAAVIAMAFPDLSWAQKLSDSVQEVRTGIETVPVVVSGIAYIAGGATMLHGAGLLKKHADAPQQNPLAPGVTRMALGGVIAALPTFMKFVNESLKTDNGATQVFQPLTKITG